MKTRVFTELISAMNNLQRLSKYCEVQYMQISGNIALMLPCIYTVARFGRQSVVSKRDIGDN